MDEKVRDGKDKKEMTVKILILEYLDSIEQ